MNERRETVVAGGFICRTLDGIVGCLDGLEASELNWRPPAAAANSLYAIAVHVLSNAEENLLQVLCGLPPTVARSEHPHPDEWATDGTSGDDLRQRWTELRERIEAALASLPAAELDRERPHGRRGLLTGREVLYVTARHAAEHQGQGELTRDLMKALKR